MGKTAIYSNVVDVSIPEGTSAFVIRIIDKPETIKARFPYKTEKERSKAEQKAIEFVSKERLKRGLFPPILLKSGLWHTPRLRSSFDKNGVFRVDEKVIGVVRSIKQPSAARKKQGSLPEICYRVVFHDYWTHDEPKKHFKDFYAGKEGHTSVEDEEHALCTAILFRYEWEQAVRLGEQFDRDSFDQWRQRGLFPSSWSRIISIEPYL